MSTARAAAARAVCEVLRSHRSLKDALPRAEKTAPSRERSLVRELCYGALRRGPRFEGLLAPLLNKPLKSQDGEILALLLIGCHQLEHTRVPDHAALNETVAACRALGKPWAAGLVNAVLRRYLGQREKLAESLAPHQRDGLPKWMAEQLRARWPVQYPAIAEAAAERPPLTLRVNQQRCERKRYVAQLQEAGIHSSLCQHALQGIRLAQGIEITDAPGFDRGLVSVQDESAQLAAPLLALQPGERLLDACAAPGGKTAHLLEQQPDVAAAVAVDTNAERMHLAEENLKRLGLYAAGRVHLHCADAAQPKDWWDGQPFDRILLDTPCSATGVLRRNPDIRYLRRAGDIPAFAKRQRALLDALWGCLKSGGLLLYVTCSLLPEENEGVVTAFLSEHGDAEHTPIEADWGEPGTFGRTALPTAGGGDGLYFARLRRH